jgi:D-alanyl-D-alanine carboxypeptidase
VPPMLDNGMAHLSSPYMFAETIKRLESLLQARGQAIFCRIDHSGEAEKAGLKMPPKQVIIPARGCRIIQQ